jgi:hypothetical protein
MLAFSPPRRRRRYIIFACCRRRRHAIFAAIAFQRRRFRHEERHVYRRQRSMIDAMPLRRCHFSYHYAAAIFDFISLRYFMPFSMPLPDDYIFFAFSQPPSALPPFCRAPFYAALSDAFRHDAPIRFSSRLIFIFRSDADSTVRRFSPFIFIADIHFAASIFACID